jgi:hypothetical protein
LTVVDATPVYRRAPALPTLLRGADYEIAIETRLSVEDARSQCQALLARDVISRKFRGKSYDLRPRIDDLKVERVTHCYLLVQMDLAAGERGTARPEEVLDELGWAEWFYRCHRRRLRFAFDKS